MIQYFTLSHAKYTVFFFVHSLHFFSSLIYTCSVDYIYFTFSLDISKWYIFLVDLFHKKPILTIPSSVGRPPLESFESKMCLYEFEEKKIIKKIIWSTEI